MKNTLLMGLLTFCSIATLATPSPQMDIVDTAVASGQFKTLVAAVSAAGLVDTLKGEGPFTVFAPTDAAFAKLPEGTVEALLKDIPTLKKILTYHVVAADLSVSALTSLGSVRTVQGQTLQISASGNKIFVNDAQIISYNIKTKNGTIQVIDSVMIPPTQFNRSTFEGKFELSSGISNRDPLVVNLLSNGQALIENWIVDQDGKNGSSCSGIWFKQEKGSLIRIQLTGCSASNFLNEIIFANVDASYRSFMNGGKVQVGYLQGWTQTIDEVVYQQKTIKVLKK